MIYIYDMIYMIYIYIYIYIIYICESEVVSPIMFFCLILKWVFQW